MTTNGNLRVGLAGAGMISLFHMRGWQEVEGADVVAVCDPSIDRAKERAGEFDVSGVYSDAETMLDECELDAIDIAASVDAHAPLVRAAAKRGVHVMVQKPLTRTVAEAERLIEEVGEGVRFMVHENYRFRPHYMTVRKWLAEGRIGEIRHAQMNVRCSGLVAKDGETPWLINRQPYLVDFDRNIVFETMIHHLDVLRLLLGPLSVKSAHLGWLNGNYRGEDTATIVLENEAGVVAVADGSLCAPGYPPLPSDRLELIGTEGTLIMDFDRIFLVGDEENAVQVDLTGRYQECFTHSIRDFTTGIREGTPFETDRLDNLQTLSLMEACYHAAGVEV
ncbi:MAG: Gfo/Idh/MocA family oxidoreductase [Rhodospirillaceae bacterium]|nr:Gfo/Idh/MocA family oxidoreductase [Rhodospirillaceae bacterium]MBT6136019.1 Gfo/Idh/MocA family oxidoreductase [Rhodospirillaceae bacterium]